jgi:hypothetical protein
LIRCGFGAAGATAHRKQKFFGSFFQKRTAFFRLAARLAD